MTRQRLAICQVIARWAAGLSTTTGGGTGAMIFGLPQDVLQHLPFGLWLPLAAMVVGSLSQLALSILDKITPDDPLPVEKPVASG